MRNAIVALFLTLPLAGCQFAYTLPVRQGNVVDQEKVDRLRVGMTREQVQFVMGTPIAASGLTPDRWDYLGFYRNPRGEAFRRTVTVHFDGDRVARLEGTDNPFAEKNEGLDSERLEEAAADDDAEPQPEAPQSGVVITPE